MSLTKCHMDNMQSCPILMVIKGEDALEGLVRWEIHCTQIHKNVNSPLEARSDLDASNMMSQNVHFIPGVELGRGRV